MTDSIRIKQTAQNQTMDCIKLVAALWVVIIHIPFPGNAGGLIGCMGRFSVPVFFAISGYFSYQTQSGKILKRIGGILKLEALGIAVQVLCSLFLHLYNDVPLRIFYGDMKLTAEKLAQWLVLNIDPYGGHLWYLSAMAASYGMLWVYVRFFGEEQVNYKPLYLLSVALLGTHFALDEFALGLGVVLPYQLTRNALLFGLPMLSLGLFLREYGERIWKNFDLTRGKLILLILTGAALCVIEWSGIGYCEIYVGSTLMTAALLLFAAAYPTVWARPGWLSNCLSRFGSLAMWIYLLHMALYDLYQKTVQQPLDLLTGGKEDWLRPILLAATSLLGAIVCERVQHLLKSLRKKTK